MTPQHRTCNTSTFTHTRFRLIRFRSPLLTESQLFSSPAGTEMFHFPAFPPHTLYIQVQVTTHNMPRGSPIRTPSDHSSFTNSPRLIAGYRVLHRLLMPRHPPCALEHSHHATTQHAARNASRITQETQQQKLHRTPQPTGTPHTRTQPTRRPATHTHRAHQAVMPRCSRPL